MTANHNRIIVFLYLSQMLFVASTFRTWLPVFSFTATMLLMAFMRQRRLAAQTESELKHRIPRWLNWSLMMVAYLTILLVTGVWRLGGQIGDNINPIYLGVDILAHASLFCSLVVWWRVPQRGHVAMLALGLLVILLCVAAGGTSVTVAAQTTVALASCVGYALAAQIILGGSKRPSVRSNEARSSESRSSYLGPLFSLLTLSVLMMATSAIANGTSVVLPGIRESLQVQLQASLDAVTDESFIGGTRYVRGSRLGSVRQHMLGDPQEIALRVRSEYTPGYLRGNVFDQFRGNRWKNIGIDAVAPQYERAFTERILSPDARISTQLQDYDRELTLNRFRLADTNDATIKIDIYNDPLKGPVIFLPLTTRWIEANSGELTVTPHNVIRMGVDLTKPYVAAVGLQPAKERMDPIRRAALLDVPATLKGDLTNIVEQVINERSAPPVKAKAISKYFQSNYGYSLESTEIPRGVSPISHFLREQHDAHCEYFATCTVLMLRTAGVPSRYVTGYVTDELNDETDFWVARNRDAHAWAEAYDDQTNEWFPVESTPGRIYQTVDPSSQTEEDDSLFDVFGNDNGDENDTFFGRLVGWILSIRATDGLLFLFRIAQFPLFCVLLFLLWSKYLRPSRGGTDAVDQQSRQLLKRADRKLKRYSLVRSPSETLYQFADRVAELAEDSSQPIATDDRSRISSLSGWYRDFADARYQGLAPQPFR
jgi:transglutaminase-like putative cysteine protease